MQAATRRNRELPDITKLDDSALITSRTACAMHGISRATLYRRIHARTFPAPRRIGASSRFVLGEVRAQARADAQAGVQ